MYKKEFVDVLKELEVNQEVGLTEAEVNERKLKYGDNALKSKKNKPWIVKFLLQFKDILIIILLLAALISFLVERSEWVESVIIVIVVLINAILGVTQETKAEKSLEALKKMSAPLAKVLRGGNIYQVESINLVPGDIVIIEAGDFIPADARLIEASNLQVDESALTGESVPVTKNIEIISGNDVPLGDQTNMIFSSTFVTYGRGIAVITGIGMDTNIGKIAGMLNEVENELTPLQVKLNQIGKVIGIVAILICIVVFLIEWLTGAETVLEAFKTSIALAVAAIPEGLSTVVTVVLAIGVTKMAKQKAIVKKLPAVETLGSTSVVCSDKTGTLTQNKMTVVKLYNDGIKNVEEELDELEKKILTFFSVCTDATISIVDGEEKRVGDPTETALIEANNKYGFETDANYDRIADLSFDSDRKMMTVVVTKDTKIYSITKGAPDIIINRCKDVDKETILEANKQMAHDALRVLAIGYRELTNTPSESQMNSEYLESDLQFLGLIGIIDPARLEVFDAIALAKSAGIRTVMITGDHVITARAIAEQLGIIGEGQEALSSEELHAMSDEELSQNIEKYAVYARVAPEDKVRIVKAWQSKDLVVAMTGDGVNDSPALKVADIGCAMGITGTDVAKEAADLILVDDNFTTIISAVQEGRGIYSNIRKAVHYLLSSNIGEVLTIFLASIISAITSLSLGVPLLPMHLLWVNLITDSLPAFALGLEKADIEVMSEKPRNKKEGFFANGLGYKIAWQGAIIGIVTLIAYIIGHTKNPDSYLGQTMAFLTLATSQLFHAFNVKSEHTLFSKKTFNNKYLILAFIAGLILQIAIIYIPFFANAFKLETLSFDYLMTCLGLAFSIVIICEIVKFGKKIFNKNKN